MGEQGIIALFSLYVTYVTYGYYASGSWAMGTFTLVFALAGFYCSAFMTLRALTIRKEIRTIAHDAGLTIRFSSWSGDPWARAEDVWVPLSYKRRTRSLTILGTHLRATRIVVAHHAKGLASVD